MSKISALIDGTTANATDRIPVARSPFASGDNRYVTPAHIRNYILGLANTWTATQAFSVNSALSAPAVAGTGTWITGGTATTTKPHFLIEPAGTTSTGWNTTGTGFGINAATGFDGNLIDLQIAGAGLLSFNPGGVSDVLTAGALCSIKSGSSGSSGIVFGNSGGSGVAIFAGNNPSFSVGGDGRTNVYTLNIGVNGAIRPAASCLLYSDAADNLALRNGTAAQTFRSYFSYSDASNYTRLALKTASGLHTIETESAGTGQADIDLALTPKGTGRVRFGSHAAVAAELVTGYITIKDSGGTARKIAVIS